MSFLNYDREYTEQYPELLEDYQKADKWAIVFVMLSALTVFVSTLLLGQESLFSGIGSGVIVLLGIVLYKFLSGSELVRISLSVAVVLFSTILIQVHAGSLEAHLYIFVSMTIFLLYKDTTPLNVATVLLITSHVFAYKLQGNGTYIFETPVVLFGDNYSLTTLGIHLFFILIEYMCIL